MRAVVLSLGLLLAACAAPPESGAPPGGQPPRDAVYLVFFTAGGFGLDEDAMTVIDAAAADAKGANVVRLTGHTSAVGPRAVNAEIARRRVESVVARLIAKGVAQDAISWVSLGENEAGFDPDGDRRVEIRLAR